MLCFAKSAKKRDDGLQKFAGLMFVLKGFSVLSWEQILAESEEISGREHAETDEEEDWLIC